MRIEQPEQPSATLSDALAKIKEKTGVSLLSNDDILVLACAELARTYTYEEKGYSRTCRQ
jgi:hypothetical protein